MNELDVLLDASPWRLSGMVYGTLMNDPAALAALGDAVDHAPYAAPPRAPVLYIKPRNTLAAGRATVALPADDAALEVGASLAIVIGRTACRVPASRAGDFVAGYTLVVDASVAHDSFYRPSVRFKALDHSCVIGARVLPRSEVADPGALAIRVFVDGRLAQQAGTAGMRRPVAELLAAVTEFMTLRPGDLLLLGVPFGAPRVGPGATVRAEIDGLGHVELRVVREAAAKACA